MTKSTKSVLVNNINSKRKDLNMKISQLSKNSGVSDKTLRKILDGSTKNPTISNVSRCARALGCTTSDLIGETKMLTHQEDTLLAQFGTLDDVSKSAVFDFIDTCKEIQGTCETITVIKQIPLFIQKVSAGIGNYLDSSNYEYLSVYGDAVPDKNVFALQISGNSMEPVLSDQDYILIEPTKELKDGDIGVFILNGESYIKKLEKDQLISFNENYEPININEYDDVTVVGRYLQKVKPVK